VLLAVYYAYFQNFPGYFPGNYLDITRGISGYCPAAISGQGNTFNELPVAFFSAREMHVIRTKYNNNDNSQ